MNAAVLIGARIAQARLDVVPTNGLAALYDFTRVNLLNWSEGPLASLTIKGGTPAPVSLPAADGFAEWFGFSGPVTASQYVYAPTYAPLMVPGQTYCMSLFVRMDDGGAAPTHGTGSTNSFRLIAFNSGANDVVVTPLGGGLYRVSGTGTYPASGANSANLNNNGVVKYAYHDARTFKVTGYQLSVGTTPLPYERTGDPQVVVDSSGNARHGTLGSSTGADSNDPTVTPAGLVFDGVDDRVVIPALPAGQNALTLSVAATVVGSGGGGYHGLIASATGSSFYPRILQTGLNLVVQWGSSAGMQHPIAYMPAGSTSATNLITATWDGATSRVYLNGQLLSSAALSFTLPQGAGSAYLGLGAPGSGGTGTYWLNGTIHHAEGRTRALSEAEVFKHYKALKKRLALRGVTLI